MLLTFSVGATIERSLPYQGGVSFMSDRDGGTEVNDELARCRTLGDFDGKTRSGGPIRVAGERKRGIANRTARDADGAAASVGNLTNGGIGGCHRVIRKGKRVVVLVEQAHDVVLRFGEISHLVYLYGVVLPINFDDDGINVYSVRGFSLLYDEMAMKVNGRSAAPLVAASRVCIT